MIDLHTHTTASDGTYSPAQLIDEATALGLEALAITDHDTFAGHDEAAPRAAKAGLDLVCGLEISTKFAGRSVHLLGYFPVRDPGSEFRGWIVGLQESRHQRNQELIAKLQAGGFAITLEEWYQRGGSLPGRPHLATLLREKGYVSSLQDAFDRYLAEGAPYYTARIEPALSEAIERIVQAGGISVLAHPKRWSEDAAALEQTIGDMCALGLQGIEVFHSSHSAADTQAYCALAERFALAATGGSDFHGAHKPDVALGTGIDGNVRVPRAVLDNIRARSSAT